MDEADNLVQDRLFLLMICIIIDYQEILVHGKVGEPQMDLVCIKALGYLALACRQPCLSPVDILGQDKVRRRPLRPVFSGYVRIQGAQW